MTLSQDQISKISSSSMPYYALRVDNDDMDIRQIAKQFNTDIDNILASNPGIENGKPMVGEVIFINLRV